MPVIFTPNQQDFMSCTEPHTLDNIVGYEVWQTIGHDGVWIDEGRGRLVHTENDGHRYSWALEVARTWRTGKSYAVVCEVYGCGHSCGDYDSRSLGKQEGEQP